MKNPGMVLALAVILSLNATASAEPASADRKGGYAVLDLYLKTFQEMALKGAKDVWETNLGGIMAEAIKAKTQNDVDQVFFSRFARLMAVTKLSLIPDKDKILQPVCDQEIRHFIKDTMGEDIPAGTKLGAGLVAEALAQEILNLQIYLDTRGQRQKMMEDFYKRFDGPEKK
jgi:hypothetical protein